jgi:hypothetical protein
MMHAGHTLGIGGVTGRAARGWGRRTHARRFVNIGVPLLKVRVQLSF